MFNKLCRWFWHCLKFKNHWCNRSIIFPFPESPGTFLHSVIAQGCGLRSEALASYRSLLENAECWALPRTYGIWFRAYKDRQVICMHIEVWETLLSISIFCLKKKWWMSDCFLCNDKKQICQMKTGLYWKELQCPFYKPNLFLKWMIFLQIPYWFCCPRRLLKPFHDKCLRSTFVLLAAW